VLTFIPDAKGSAADAVFSTPSPATPCTSPPPKPVDATPFANPFPEGDRMRAIPDGVSKIPVRVLSRTRIGRARSTHWTDNLGRLVGNPCKFRCWPAERFALDCMLRHTSSTRCNPAQKTLLLYTLTHWLSIPCLSSRARGRLNPCYKSGTFPGEDTHRRFPCGSARKGCFSRQR
jgi:hypothetical protein